MCVLLTFRTVLETSSITPLESLTFCSRGLQGGGLNIYFLGIATLTDCNIYANTASEVSVRFSNCPCSVFHDFDGMLTAVCALWQYPSIAILESCNCILEYCGSCAPPERASFPRIEPARNVPALRWSP